MEAETRRLRHYQADGERILGELHMRSRRSRRQHFATIGCLIGVATREVGRADGEDASLQVATTLFGEPHTAEGVLI